MSEKNPQKELFESIHQTYVNHYFSKSTLYWKQRLVWKFIKDLNLKMEGTRVAEFFCGAGYNTQELLTHFKPASVIGLDISDSAVTDFKKLTGQKAFQADLSEDIPFKNEFDFIFVFGGLHHAYHSLDKVLLNISEALVPGGYLIAYEPLRETIWDKARDFWYKNDKYFDADSEYPLVPEEIEKHGLKKLKLRLITGPGYIIIYNSMILRVPLFLANILAAPLTAIDLILSSFGLKWISFCFVGVYRKT